MRSVTTQRTEDDIYVTRDFVAATRALSRVREEHCRECMGSTVGWHGAQEFARRGKSPLLTQYVILCIVVVLDERMEAINGFMYE